MRLAGSKSCFAFCGRGESGAEDEGRCWFSVEVFDGGRGRDEV